MDLDKEEGDASVVLVEADVDVDEDESFGVAWAWAWWLVEDIVCVTVDVFGSQMWHNGIKRANFGMLN